MMDAKLFAELLESVTQMGEIARGERAPARPLAAVRQRSECRSCRKHAAPIRACLSAKRQSSCTNRLPGLWHQGRGRGRLSLL
jgi:hypothetical protein